MAGQHDPSWSIDLDSRRQTVGTPRLTQLLVALLSSLEKSGWVANGGVKVGHCKKHGGLSQSFKSAIITAIERHD